MENPSPSSVLAAGVALPVVGLAFLALRFTLRYKVQHQLGIDDWILLPSWLLLAGMGSSLIAGVVLRVLGHPTHQPGSNFKGDFGIATYNSTVASQIEWAILLMQPAQIACVKLSFLFFYRRIFVVSNRTSAVFSTLTWIGIGIVVAWAVAFTLTQFLACVAVSGSFSAFWGSGIDLTTKCVQTEVMSTAFTISEFIMDVYVIFLPIPRIWQLHMSTSRKLGVSAVFLTGLVAVAASILRMTVFIQELELGFNPDLDEVLLITKVLFWTMIESGLALIAVCLPIMQSFWRLPVIRSWLDVVRRSPSTGFVVRENNWQDQNHNVQHIKPADTAVIRDSNEEV